EDGIRDKLVTGVQTCALPISTNPCLLAAASSHSSTRAESGSTTSRGPRGRMSAKLSCCVCTTPVYHGGLTAALPGGRDRRLCRRSEERRVGKGGRRRRWRVHW